jgi:hypothetical protein
MIDETKYGKKKQRSTGITDESLLKGHQLS